MSRTLNVKEFVNWIYWPTEWYQYATESTAAKQSKLRNNPSEQHTYLQRVQMLKRDRQMPPHSHEHSQRNITHCEVLSARPYSQPFLGCCTSTVIISPLKKGSRVGLEPPGWWATRALMDLPPTVSAGEREMLPTGDGAGARTSERERRENSVLQHELADLRRISGEMIN